MREPKRASEAETVTAAERALARGDWQGAVTAFRAAIEDRPSPEAYEGLGMACWWLDDADGAIHARERAFRSYRTAGDQLGAARAAVALAWDSVTFGGRAAVAHGWLERARRLLESHPLAAEHGWLAVREAEVALRVDGDPPSARERASRAAAIGRELGREDLEVVARGLDGLAQVMAGDVQAGLRTLDEAVAGATGGDIDDLMWMGKVCCFLIRACETVRDYERAAQWCDQVSEFCERWNLAPLFAVCRTHYASVLISRGVWDAAEAELERALNALSDDSRRTAWREGTIRLGELRRRQGRAAEAEALFAQAPEHPQAQIGRAAIALDRGDATTAVETLEALLRKLPASSRLPRVAALELLVRAHAALDNRAAAGRSSTELRTIADAAGTTALQAADGVVAAMDDEAAACRLIEQAVDAFSEVSPYEAAQARLELAGALDACGHADRARAEAQAARSILQDLGVRASSRGHGSQLSPRELEVLRLVAAGLANREIAERLVLSEHTLHRHVANILNKLG